MRELYGDLMDVSKGIICHQVNCKNEIGAGVSGAILKKYPMVGDAYHEHFQGIEDWDNLLGDIQYVKITPDLTVANLFTQCDYGNSAVTGKVYTDVNLLVSALSDVCRQHPESDVYIPGYIGCALAGANWEEVREKIRNLPLTVVYLKK